MEQPLKFKKIGNRRDDKFKNTKEYKVKALMSILRVKFSESEIISIKDCKNMNFGSLDRYKDFNSNSNNISNSNQSKEKKNRRKNDQRPLNINKHDSINKSPDKDRGNTELAKFKFKLNETHIEFNIHKESPIMIQNYHHRFNLNLEIRRLPNIHSGFYSGEQVIKSLSPPKIKSKLPDLFNVKVIGVTGLEINERKNINNNNNNNSKKIVNTIPSKFPICLVNPQQSNFNSLDYIKSIHNYTQIESKIENASHSPQNNYTFYLKNKSDIANILPIMKHRVNWIRSLDKQQYNFLWKYSTKKVEYKKFIHNENGHKDKIKVINLFEYHEEISNKKGAFLNLLHYCNSINLNVFDFIPFTIIMYKMNKSFDHNYKSFIEIFDFFDNLSSDAKFTNNNFLTNKQYEEYFNTTAIAKQGKQFKNVKVYFPGTFISSKNYWVIKANDLCQGRCIKLCNDKSKIFKKVKKFFMGIDNSYKDSDQETKNIKPVREVNISKLPVLSTLNPSTALSPSEKPIPKDEKEIKKKKKISKRYLSSSVILQKYLEKPLLYKNRKFDIRQWVLVDHCQNVFMFKEGHLKASSVEYDANNKNPFVHLTNYSVQKKSEDFSKYEFGNEISFNDFQNHLKEENINIEINKDIVPQIKTIIDISMTSVGKKINLKNSKFCFQIFGYDFIIDKNYKVWLLEINDNPGLSESSPLIKMLVPRMIDDAFRLTLDKIYDTEFDDSVYDKNTNIYKTKFSVDGYSDYENMFEFICNI